MMTFETISSKSVAKKKPLLWFFLSLLAALSLFLTSVYLVKNMRLAVVAQQDQTLLVQQRNILLQESDILQSNWLKTLNPLAKKTQGDLIWSNQQQKGWMRFANLPKLTEKQRYHLWIYDLESSVTEPISSTQFQADPRIKKEFLVEILASKIVKKPYKFVLKVESEGQPDQILLLAQP
ncbi:MAG: hypothetical protein KAG20_02850 [Cocleimonas sp.]|nr:hypothetical protein [Cocleimonas sp.]